MTKFLVGLEKFLHSLTHSFCRHIVKTFTFLYLFLKQQKVLHLFCRHTTKSIESFGFRCFFVAKTPKMVWVKMWVNCLTHTVTHIGWQSAALPPTASSCPMGTTKCAERVKEYRRGNRFLSGALLACGTYRICAMKLPIFSAAFCCICRVTWV